jgi:hypothetical protein
MENVKKAERILGCFEQKNRFYWLQVLVKQGVLNEAQAGFLVIKFNL